jgi:hypothetical protein
MKTLWLILLVVLLGFAPLVSVFGAAPSPLDVPGSSAVSVQETRREKWIQGIVKDREEDLLVIVDRVNETKESRVKLTARTRYFMGGREVTADEVTIGAPVAVITRQGADQGLEAMEVRVIRAVVGGASLEPLTSARVVS